MPRRLLLAILVALAALPSVAQATDSHAPEGARGDWLPRSAWVMSSWTPFDEARLYSLLDTDRKHVAAWLDDTPHARPARGEARRSATERAFAEKLVAPRLPTASARAR